MKKVHPQKGDERIVHFFAWWPVFVRNEERWLEWVTIRQKFIVILDLPVPKTFWRNEEFM